MKKSIVTIIIAAAVAGAVAVVSVGPASANIAAAETKFDVDGTHSSVLFGVKHLDLSHFYGRFNDVDGKFIFQGQSLDELSIYIKVDAGSVDTNDKKRDRHLKNQDFFNSKQFRDITFKSTGFKMLEPDKFEVTGDLSLHGVTKPITTIVHHTGTGNKGERYGSRSGFETEFTIKRSDFGMTYGLEGDVLGDEVKIIVAIEGKRTQPAA